jgi:hypothetical protein
MKRLPAFAQYSSAAFINSEPRPDFWYCGSTDTKPKVGPIAFEFDVNTASQSADTIRDQENPGLKQFPHCLRVDTIAINEEALGLAKRSVDHGNDCQRVSNVGYGGANFSLLFVCLPYGAAGD